MWAAPGTGAGEAEPEELDMITQRHFAGLFLFNWEIPNHYSPVGTGSNRFMIVYRGSKHACCGKLGDHGEYRAVRQRNTHHSARCVMTSINCNRAGRSISRAGCLDFRFIYFVEVPPLQEHAKVPFVTFITLVHSTNVRN
jgi:hypothetical protein